MKYRIHFLVVSDVFGGLEQSGCVLHVLHLLYISRHVFPDPLVKIKMVLVNKLITLHRAGLYLRYINFVMHVRDGNSWLRPWVVRLWGRTLGTKELMVIRLPQTGACPGFRLLRVGDVCFC